MDLKSLYNDPKFTGSFSGQNQFIEALREVDPLIKRKDVIKYLKSDDAYTLHKPIQKPKRYRRVYTKGIAYLYQIDLVDMSSLSRQNRGYKWIINCIDTFSKKLWSFKTKRKTGQLITNALRPLLTATRPQKIQVDQGTEFYNSNFTNLLRRLNIQMYSTSSDKKSSIVERVNRTIKTRMYRAFTARGSHTWYNILDDLVNGYNNSFHRSIKCTPNEVTSVNENEIRDRLFPREIPGSPPKFKTGDTVRISRAKSLFQKGYEQSWSYEVFEILNIKNTNPVTYEIKDFNSSPIKGSFYESELQVCDKSSGIFPIERIVRTRRSRGQRQYLVKFAGYPDIFNSWVNQQDLFNL